MGSTISGIRDHDTLCKRLKFLANNFPDRELFIFYNHGIRDVYTSKELFQLGGKFAALLRQKGFQRHDVIANALPNSPERVVTEVGIILAGCVAMNAPLLLADGSDFFEVAKKARCRAVVADIYDKGPASTLFLPYNGGATSSSKRFIDLNIDSAPELTSAINVFRDGDTKTLLEELRSCELDTVFEPCEPDDLVKVFTTSGSTGFSKLVSQTHDVAIHSWEGYVDFLETQAPVNELGNYGYYNDTALGWLVGFPFGTFVLGSKRVLSDVWSGDAQARSGAAMWEIIRTEKCRSSTIMPVNVYSILEHVRKTGDDSFRMSLSMVCGQPLRKKCFQEAFTISEKLLVAYGSTEVGGASGGILSEEQLDEVQDFFCGPVADYLSLQVVDKDEKECAVGKVGTVMVKGKTLFSGYFNQLEEKDPATTGQFSEDGWFDTNDNGYFDHKGSLYVIGRNNDVISYGACLVYPGWLEQKILAHPKVRNVCLVPVPHPVLYQDMCACVLAAPDSQLTQDELRQFCAHICFSDGHEEKPLIPTYFLIMDQYPLTDTGKTSRKELRRLATHKFGVQ